MKDEIDFDMQAASQALREDKGLSGQDGILTPLVKQPLYRPPFRGDPASSPGRKLSATGDQTGYPKSGHKEAGQLSYFAPLFRDASAGTRYGHSYPSGTA